MGILRAVVFFGHLTLGGCWRDVGGMLEGFGDEVWPWT